MLSLLLQDVVFVICIREECNSDSYQNIKRKSFIGKEDRISPSLKYSTHDISRSLGVTHEVTQQEKETYYSLVVFGLFCFFLALISYTHFSFLLLIGTTDSSSM